MSFLLDYFEGAFEDRQVLCSFLSLCLLIPHIRSFSIIQEKYLIFIPKWKLFYNVGWKKGRMGARDKEEGTKVCSEHKNDGVCVVDGWLLISVFSWVILKCSALQKFLVSLTSSVFCHIGTTNISWFNCDYMWNADIKYCSS